jgi:hypothetical protein
VDAEKQDQSIHHRLSGKSDQNQRSPTCLDGYPCAEDQGNEDIFLTFEAARAELSNWTFAFDLDFLAGLEAGVLMGSS